MSQGHGKVRTNSQSPPKIDTQTGDGAEIQDVSKIAIEGDFTLDTQSQGDGKVKTNSQGRAKFDTQTGDVPKKQNVGNIAIGRNLWMGFNSVDHTATYYTQRKTVGRIINYAQSGRYNPQIQGIRIPGTFRTPYKKENSIACNPCRKAEVVRGCSCCSSRIWCLWNRSEGI